MGDHVEELERVRRTPWFRLGALFVAALTVLGTLVATWQNLVLRAAAVVLLGALVVFVLEGAPGRSRAGRPRGKGPQQPVQASELGQIRIELPPDFEIESSQITSSAGTTPVDVALESGVYADSPGYEEYLRTLLPGTTQALLTWPWTADKAAFNTAGWRAAMVVAVSSNEEDCAIAAVDLLSDQPELLGTSETEAILNSGRTREHVPSACL